MSQETKTIILISIITILVVIGGLYLWNKSSNTANTPAPAVVVDRNELVPEDSHIVGSIDAKVIVTEFGDYECPACAAAYPVVKGLMEKYKENPEVAFVFRNYPLPQHRNAVYTASLAEAAALQGKFWEAHGILYETQTKWMNASNAKKVALEQLENIGIDLEKLVSDASTSLVDDRIDFDKKDAERFGVNSTPTFFINETMQDSWGFESLSRSIDAALIEPASNPLIIEE